MLLGSTALAEIIDIFPTGTGWQIQRATGEILGSVSSQQAAQKAADVYTRQGNTVNWRSATPTTTGVSTAANTGASAGTSGSYISSSRQLTGGSNLPATTTQPGQNLPATTGSGGSGGGSGGASAGSAASRVNAGGAALGAGIGALAGGGKGAAIGAAIGAGK